MMTPQEDNAVRVLAQAVDRLAIEQAGLRQSIDERLRLLESAQAARDAIDRVESKLDDQKLRKRDVYVPVLLSNIVVVAMAGLGILATSST